MSWWLEIDFDFSSIKSRKWSSASWLGLIVESREGGDLIDPERFPLAGIGVEAAEFKLGVDIDAISLLKWTFWFYIKFKELQGDAM